MLSIKVFEHNIAKDALQFVCEIDNPQSVFYTSTLYSVGDFTIKINRYMSFATALTLGRFIVVNSDFRKVGIITDVIKEINEDGKESEFITVKGKEAKFILNDRIVIPSGGSAYYNKTDSIEADMKDVVLKNIGASAATARIRSDFTIATDQDRGPTYTINSRYDNLLTVLQNAGEATSTGFELSLDPDTRKFVFEFILGKDRTTDQSTNDIVVFSTDFDTLKSAKYTKTSKNFVNLAVVGGTGTGASRVIRTVYNTTEPSGVDRKEKFIDARDLSTNPELDARGLENITTSTQNFLEGEQLTYSLFVFRTNYDIGDTVTVRAFDAELDVQITEVRENWTAGNYTIALTYGKQELRFDTAVKKNAVDSFKLKAI